MRYEKLIIALISTVFIFIALVAVYMGYYIAAGVIMFFSIATIREAWKRNSKN